MMHLKSSIQYVYKILYTSVGRNKSPYKIFPNARSSLKVMADTPFVILPKVLAYRY